ncbi:MAG TPA: carboxymuconolactone decarboxylase family protein [Steroidobacteraceae bacterium]|jgi:AhpD family alkylhydroperoxidase
MQARMKNPAAIVPGALEAIQSLIATVQQGGAPAATLQLAHLRASQINGCAPCVEGGVQHARQAGETLERLSAIAVWRESQRFTEPERAALALAEAMTRLSDRADAVPDAVWEEAARHFDERGLAGLVLWLGLVNLFNRVNVATRQVPGAAW